MASKYLMMHFTHCHLPRQNDPPWRAHGAKKQCRQGTDPPNRPRTASPRVLTHTVLAGACFPSRSEGINK
eukprot:scaffold3069_cov292-Pinguiococcus_pyrenoidosus.AAC.3